MKTEYMKYVFFISENCIFLNFFVGGRLNSTDNELNDDGNGDDLISLLGNLILKDFKAQWKYNYI